MRVGRRLRHCSLALVVGVLPLLTACGLFDRGSALDDALEYLPSATFRLRFADRAAWMSDAPLDAADIEWEADATWGDPEGERRSARVWKVDDDVDLDELGDDLEDEGYDKETSHGSAIYSADRAAMRHVLVNEDEQVVGATAATADALRDVAEVVADDADSLADDDSEPLDDLVDVVDDPGLAVIATGGATVCPPTRSRVPQDQRELVGALGRPEARGFFVSDEDDAKATVALRYGSEDAAQDDVEAREAYLADGRDLATGRPFADLGDFSVEQDDEVLLVEEEWKGGTARALTAEQRGGGPGRCGPAS